MTETDALMFCRTVFLSTITMDVLVPEPNFSREQNNSVVHNNFTGLFSENITTKPSFVCFEMKINTTNNNIFSKLEN